MVGHARALDRRPCHHHCHRRGADAGRSRRAVLPGRVRRRGAATPVAGRADSRLPDGTISFRVQAFLVEQPGHVTLVDPCVGNAKERTLPFWNQLEHAVARASRGDRCGTRSDRPRRAHAPARGPRRLGHAPRRRRVDADVHERAPPLRWRRARLLAIRGAPGRRDDESSTRSIRSSPPASPTSSRPTPISATACACCRHQGTRPGMPRSRSHRATNA